MNNLGVLKCTPNERLEVISLPSAYGFRKLRVTMRNLKHLESSFTRLVNQDVVSLFTVVMLGLWRLVSTPCVKNLV